MQMSHLTGVYLKALFSYAPGNHFKPTTVQHKRGWCGSPGIGSLYFYLTDCLLALEVISFYLSSAVVASLGNANRTLHVINGIFVPT